MVSFASIRWPWTKSKQSNPTSKSTSKPTSKGSADSELPVHIEQAEGSIKDAAIMDEHLVEVADVCARLGTSFDVEHPSQSRGLTEEEAAARLAITGENRMRERKTTPILVVYVCDLVCNLFNALLLASGVISIILWAATSSTNDVVGLALGAILVLVALGNALIDVYQEHRTAVLLDSFASMVPQHAAVLRGGRARELPAAELVPGDLVHVQAGARVPADLRILAATDLHVDNSSLTGESEPQERTAARVPSEHAQRSPTVCSRDGSVVASAASTPDLAAGRVHGKQESTGSILSAPNLVFGGTTVVSGEGYGVVLRTGDQTALGAIAGLAVGEETPESQLTVEIGVFVRRMGALALATAVGLGIVSLALGHGLGATFALAVGLLVAFVPQGLPVTVSLLLTMAAQRMSRRHVLVKNLHAVETLGAITLLATDKTGTLTQNRMAVVGAWLNGVMYAAELDAPAGEAAQPSAASDESRLTRATPYVGAALECCALCTRARLDPGEDGVPLLERKILGDATEVGLLRFAARYLPLIPATGEAASGAGGDAQLDVLALQAQHEKVFEIPFSSATKWHLVVVAKESPPGTTPGHYTAYLKGAPERVARMCSMVLLADAADADAADADTADGRARIVPWSERVQQRFDEAYVRFASRGRRVLALASRALPCSQHCSQRGHGAGSSGQHAFVPGSGPPSDFTLLGLVAIMDPPKHGVRRAVAACRQAGVQVVMVTGDHPATAEAIARQIGLVRGTTRWQAALRLGRPPELVGEDEYDAVVVHGEQLDALDDRGWDAVLSKDEIVFARTSPEQKLHIVTRFQTKGHIVGVTGDGVNDSPALKKADLGVSMNASASDVSKDAAAMILLDDNFASVVGGIAEGRLIFVNLQKSIRYTLTHILPEIVPTVLFLVLGMPLPLNPLLVLIIDLGTELAPALSYAHEPAEADLMLLPPRKVLCEPLYAHESAEAVSDSDRDLEAGADGLVSAAALAKAPGRLQKASASAASAWAGVVSAFRTRHVGETLVGAEALCWVYLQGGVIVSLGATGAYLAALAVQGVPLSVLPRSAAVYWMPGAPPLELPVVPARTIGAAEQMAILGRAQSAYFAGIVICQVANLYLCKRRYTQPWAPPGLWRLLAGNRWTLPGVLVSLAVAAVVVYVPWIDTVALQGGPVPGLALLAPLGAAALLVVYELVRRALLQRGLFGGIPQPSDDHLDLVRTTSSAVRPH